MKTPPPPPIPSLQGGGDEVAGGSEAAPGGYLNTEADSDHVQRRGKVETQENRSLRKKFTVDSTCPGDPQTL